MTLSEQIKSKIAELKNLTNLHPQDAAQKLVELTILFSSLSQEVAGAHYWFNVLLNEILEKQEKKNATAAKIKAQASDEYKTLLELQGLASATEEIIRSLKILIRTSERDYQFKSNQF